MSTKTDDGTDQPKRHRLIIDTEDETLNAALQLRASKMSVSARRRVSKSEAAAAILAAELAVEIKELDKYQAGPAKKQKSRDTD